MEQTQLFNFPTNKQKTIYSVKEMIQGTLNINIIINTIK